MATVEYDQNLDFVLGFGERALLDGGKRTGTIKSVSPDGVIVGTLDKAQFNEIIRASLIEQRENVRKWLRRKTPGGLQADARSIQAIQDVSQEINFREHELLDVNSDDAGVGELDPNNWGTLLLLKSGSANLVHGPAHKPKILSKIEAGEWMFPFVNQLDGLDDLRYVATKPCQCLMITWHMLLLHAKKIAVNLWKLAETRSNDFLARVHKKQQILDKIEHDHERVRRAGHPDEGGLNDVVHSFWKKSKGSVMTGVDPRLLALTKNLANKILG